ncbi:MAG TPA: PRC-barrel domain-containing protein [Stellaceae bacterium]|jgi:hypothetical protein
MTKLWRGLALLWLGGIASPMLTAGLSGDALAAAAAGTDEHRYGPPRLERAAAVASDQPPDRTAAAAVIEARTPAHRSDLVASTGIIGRPVRDPQGDDAGIIRDVLVDPRTGAVRFALLGSSGGTFDLDGRTAAVPWPLMHVPADTLEMARVDMAASRIEATALHAGAVLPPSDRAVTAGDGPLISASRMLGAQVYADAKAGAKAGARAGTGHGPPGEVSGVVIDLRYGHVAYCTLSWDDGYGTAMPVPLPALAWAPDLGVFTYRAVGGAAATPPPGPAAEPPAAKTAADLSALYARFHAAPYWLRSGRADGTSPSPADTPRHDRADRRG